MHTRIKQAALAATLGLSLAVTSSGLLAGTGVRVKGDVDEVSQQVEAAFVELDITREATEKDAGGTTATGKNPDGSRISVAVAHAGKDECEVTVDSEDPDIEERFLRLMRSR